MPGEHFERLQLMVWWAVAILLALALVRMVVKAGRDDVRRHDGGQWIVFQASAPVTPAGGRPSLRNLKREDRDGPRSG